MINDKKIKSNEYLHEIHKATNKESNHDFVPDQIADKVQLTMDVNPYNTKTINVVKTAQTPTTLYTTPTGNVDFYLTNLAISVADDFNSGGQGLATITLTIADGTSTVFACATDSTLNGGGPTGANTQNSISIEFPKAGVLLKPGTTITTSGFQVAQWYMIAGYTVDRNIYTQNDSTM